MKNSFSTLELILAVIVSSIIFVYSAVFIKELFYINQDLQEIETNRLDMLSTKIFLQKQSQIDKKLKLENKTLYFEDSILLKNVVEFKLGKTETIITIDINLDDKIKQTWKFKK